MAATTSARDARVAGVAALHHDQAILQRAVDESKEAGSKGHPLSVATMALIRLAETADISAWQIEWSNANAVKRATMAAPAQGYAKSRRRRLGLHKKSKRDEWLAVNGFVSDRMMAYVNFLNRRGDAANRRTIPTSRATASSLWDWEAAVEAKLLFAVCPNLNPKEPLTGAKHSSA